jgi:hypothetical protein
MTYALVAEGRIPPIRLGRHIRNPRVSLIAHLQGEAEEFHGQGVVSRRGHSYKPPRRSRDLFEAREGRLHEFK